ncbi:MAG: WXG100 family type VII secretion target [Nocardia sp.]|nr:WXG100 family type VII secretion target [Nocardia sp.]
MGSNFSVDLDHLDQTVARLSGLAGFVSDHLAEIERRVTALQAGGWDGLAARAYGDAHRDWASGAQEFVKGVEEMSEAARGAHTAYTRALGANHRMLAGGQR